jgi:hypothetical protein
MALPADWADDDHVEIEEHANGWITIRWPDWPELIQCSIAPDMRTEVGTFRALRRTIQEQVGMPTEDTSDA